MSRYKGYNSDWGKKATMKYMKEKRKRLDLSWKKEEFEEVIMPAAEKAGVPVSTFIKQAINEKIEREKDV